MRILHFYPESDSMITKYVSMLCDAMGEYAETGKATNLISLRKQISSQCPEILHLHGCWHTPTALAARIARKKGIRIVLTPHGQLERWIMRHQYWKEKLPKTILFQKRIVRNAYSVIAMGKMEENSLKRLKWNRRIEIVRNPLITETVSVSDAGLQVYNIYQKILNSDVINLMDTNTRDALEPLIKVGITGDQQWLNDREYNALRHPDEIDWHKIMVYAYQENIIQTIIRGLSVMNLPVSDIRLSEIPCYYPDKHTASCPLADQADSATTDSNRYIVAMIRQARKYISHGELTISHITELSAELRLRDIEDDKVSMMLDELHLTKFAGRLMHVMSDMTGLDEGFMPVAAINDNKANKIKTIITKHLEI